MYFFTSDIHFNDAETIIQCFRPYKTTKAFDRFVIKQFNKQAKRKDTIFVIGDLVDCDNERSLSWKKSLKYIKKIKADVVLILGNNEERVINLFFNGDFNYFRYFCIKKMGFKDVFTSLNVTFNNQTFHLTHKPIDYKLGFINLFGHTHRGSGIYKPFGLNVCCDLHHYRLLSQNDIQYLLEIKKNYWDNDQNINIMKVDK